jgi:hypothetical protein
MHQNLLIKAAAFLNFLKAYRVWLCSLFIKGKLPPGNLANIYTREIKDQTYLLKQLNTHGPIIKARMGFFLTICVVG